MTSDSLLALFDEDSHPATLARSLFYVPAPSRNGEDAGRSQAGGVFLHEPTAAALLPSDLPALSRRRPDFARLRYVLVRFSFMLDRLPPRHAYQSMTLRITLADSAAAVRLQQPAWVTVDTESTDTVTTQLTATVDSLAKLGAARTRVRGITRHAGELPIVTAERRAPGDFGWVYEAREGAPLLPRIEYMLAGIELPRATTKLSGHLSAQAMVQATRFGLSQKLRAAPAQPPAPFTLWLGEAG